jgi:peptidyl-prolyl cis-trans isomerase SurA
MEEFKDGNVLFEIMERNVWGNAASDSAGLLNHYNANMSSYKWAPSAGVIIFNCNNKTTANTAVAELKKGKPWKQVVADGNNNIQADSGRYELSQLPLATGKTASEGLITDPVTNTPDGSTGFIQVLKIYEGNQQRSFNEARGLVINDYQNILEEKWVNDLKKKYLVKINEAVFQSLLK